MKACYSHRHYSILQINQKNRLRNRGERMREQGRTVWDGDAVHTRTPTAIKLPKKETLWKQVEEVGGKKKNQNRETREVNEENAGKWMQSRQVGSSQECRCSC